MTTYTAGDFKRARFATHPDGRLAARTFPDDTWPWITRVDVEKDGAGQFKDREMRDLGFVPVQETPRPLTADDITDEMVERARDAWGRSCSNGPAVFRRVLVEALTEPTRPEGAEGLQALIRQAEAEGEGADNEALANYLATRLLDPTVKEQS